MPSNTLTARLTASLPHTRESRIIAANAFVGSTGTGLFLAGSALYFTRYAGLTATQLGLGMAVAGLVGFLTSVPIGRLADRFGARDVLLVACLWRAAGYVAYLFVHGFPQFVLAASLLYVMDRGSTPLNQVLVGSLVDKAQRTRTMGFVSALRNIGFTIGFGAAAVALVSGSATGFRLLFVGNALSFLFMFVTLNVLPRVRPSRVEEGADPDAAAVPVRPPLRDPLFVGVTAANAVLYLHDAILMTVLPLWVADHTRAPIWMITVLAVTNTVLTVLGQVKVAEGIDDLRSATRATTRSALLLSACCVTLALSSLVHTPVAVSAVLVLAVLLLTGAEMLHSASSWQLSFDLSPQSAQGRYISFFNLGFSASEIAGPVVVLWLVGRAGGAAWLLLALCFPLAALLSRAACRRAGARPGAGPAAAADDAGAGAAVPLPAAP